MTLGLIGKKIAMTRVFDDKGSIVPVTIVQAGPCPILQVKKQATDGYSALQLGFDAKRVASEDGKKDGPRRRTKLSPKAEIGHAKKAGLAAPPRIVREVRIDNVDEYEVGKTIDVSIFEAGEKVDVVGTSKGRGWAGVVKRHHSTRGPETHGSMYHRRPGSMGASSDPSHVWKGKKLPGQMGNERVTTQNVQVFRVDKENNLILLRGSVPGHNNAYVVLAKSKKSAKRAARAAKAGAKK